MHFFTAFPDAWLTGTATLTTEETGAFWNLCCYYIAKDGRVPDDAHLLARVVKLGLRRWRLVRQTLIEGAFIEIRDGFIWQAKCEERLEKDGIFQRSQRDKAQKRWAAKQAKQLAERDSRHAPADTGVSAPGYATTAPASEEGYGIDSEPLPETPSTTHTLSPRVILTPGEGEDRRPPPEPDRHPGFSRAVGYLGEHVFGPCKITIVVWSDLDGWLRRGDDLQADIVPAIRRVITQRRKDHPDWAPKSLEDFAEAIRQARIERVMTMTPKPQARGNGADGSNGGDNQFEIFWRAYPRREGGNPKKPAREKFAAAIRRGVSPAAIILGAKNYAAEIEREGKAGTRFVAHAKTWIAQERWTDYQTASQPNEPKVGWL